MTKPGQSDSPDSGPAPGAGAPARAGAAAPRTTWVVLCTTAGRPFPEYVEGDQVRTEPDGSLCVFDHGAIVRRFAAGAWSTYAEWVTSTGWSALTDGLERVGLIPGQRERTTFSLPSISPQRTARDRAQTSPVRMPRSG